MKMLCKVGVAIFIALSNTHVLAAGLDKKELLYVGVQRNVNEGVVTTDQGHLNGTTKKIGYTVDDASAEPAGDFTEVFVGITGGVNAGVVSTDTNHKGGSTRSIGYLSIKPFRGSAKLYVGEVQNCNAGVVTISTMHLGCATRFVGYALPQ